jgi:O-antigen/teichoic acid export membrane protein
MKKGIPGLWRKALFLLSGNSATALLTLARNLLVARMLPVADYGIAATFAITMAVVEMASALGLQQQIIQAKDGDDPRFQAALQGFQVLRGAVSALILLAIAHPLAAFLGIPEVVWAYQVLAVMPVLNALQHFDMHRIQRRMIFGPVLATSLLPAALSLMLIWPLVVWFGDWQAMLWAIIAQGLASMLMSHLVAERPYRLTLDRTIMARNLAFGWPLLLNTILLFLVFNGEKLIVGRELGMEALGIFAMGMTLTLTPTLVMAKSASGYLLPPLSKAAGSPPLWQGRVLASVQAILLAASVIMVVAAIIGPFLVRVLLGDKYAALGALMIWMGIMQGIRMFKAGPAIAALSVGQTGNALVANLVRVALLPLGWYVAVTSGDLKAIIWLAICGEVVGHVVATTLLWRKGGVNGGRLFMSHIGVIGICMTVGTYAILFPPTSDLQLVDLVAAILFAALLGLTFLGMTELREALRTARPGYQ